MTTWDNTDATFVENTHGKYKERTYKVTGVSGDTGGTITVNGATKIINAFVSAYQAADMVAALQWRISSNTVVLTYTNPAASHTVDITVIYEGSG